ncbi:uncharacterized protein [Pagrus major]|uniref:uncharacterized protein n=1 Tax=Pagrus major TaxID=143350 RepID=UPI003CC8D7CB
MMGFVHVAVAVLSLLSVGQSAPVNNCESLTKLIEIQSDQLLGKWMVLAESTNIPGSKKLTKMFVESSWVKITASNESGVMDVFQSQKMFDTCFTISATMKLENGTLSMEKPAKASEVLLKTSCPDCLVISANYTMGQNTFGALQLLSKRAKVTAAELEEFAKQVECTGLPPPAFLDPEKGVCPDDSSSQETETTDLTDVMTDIPEVFDQLQKLINTEGGMNELINIISSSVAAMKEN